MMELEIKGKILKSGNRPLICVPLMGKTREDIMEHLDRIIQESKDTNIDIVEFRGDIYDELLDLNKLKSLLMEIRECLKEQILLFTIRSPREGGEQRAYTSCSIEEVNTFVIDNKLADMVDVELLSVDENALDITKAQSQSMEQPNIIKLAKERKVKIIMSNHDFHKTPSKEEMVARLVRMQQLGADVAKLAVMPNSVDDLKALLAATTEMNVKHGDTPVVTMSMGKLGEFSRISGEVFGSAFTFGAVGKVSAPGQIQVRELNDLLDMFHANCV